MKRMFLSWTFAMSCLGMLQGTARLAHAEEARTRLSVLAIGVNNYEGTQATGTAKRVIPLKSLKYAVADAEEIGQVIQEMEMPLGSQFDPDNPDALQGILNTKHIVTMTDNSPEELRPTYENVKRVLGDLQKKPSDTLMVLFFGHGVTVDDDSYWCLADTRIQQVAGQDSRISIDRGLPVQDISDFLASSNANMKVLVTDACRRFGEDGDLSDLNLQNIKNYNMTAHRKHLSDESQRGQYMDVSSCVPGQLAMELDELGHGIFAYHLIHGLKGNSDFDHGNRDGKVSLNELFYYVAGKTRRDSVEKVGRRQVPYVEGASVSEIAIARLNDEVKGDLAKRFVSVDMSMESLAYQKAPEDFSQALVEFGSLDLNKCLELCDSVIETFPKHQDARKLRGFCYALTGRVVDAIKEFQQLNMPLQARVFAEDPKLLGRSPEGKEYNVVMPVSKGDVLEIATYSIEQGSEPAGRYLYVKRFRKKGSKEWTELKENAVVLSDAIKPTGFDDAIQTIRDGQSQIPNVPIQSQDEIRRNSGVQSRGVGGNGGRLINGANVGDLATLATRGLALANAIQSPSASNIVTAITGQSHPGVNAVEQAAHGNWQGAVQNVAPGVGEVMNRVNRIRGIVGF